ncbi:MAG: hypothetical protein J6C04_05515, partial [Oscillospiraceae bacterium]|nr:hypothetical protein [Oscillospiraceae bacterium]
MKQKLQKGLAVLLVFAMLFTLVPAGAFAASEVVSVGDFTIIATDGETSLTENTDYIYDDGVLTVKTIKPITIGMKN